jgi:hypothetical protein
MNGNRVIPVIQAGTQPSGPPEETECRFTPSVPNLRIPAAGSSGSLTITTDSACSWAVTSSVDWLTIDSGASGTGTGTVNYTVAPNTDALPRTGALTISGKRVVPVIQAGTMNVPSFTDISQDDPVEDFVELMKSRGITFGCSATPAKFCPDGTVTRGQMAAFLVRALMGGDTFTAPATQSFTDVSTTSPFYRHVEKLKELGITTGCSTTPAKFCPDDPVTRAQMAIFLVRARLGDQFPSDKIPFFTDVPSGSAAFPFVQQMKEMGITTGCSATQFCPDQATTRSQMAVFLSRALLTPIF